MHQRDEDGRTDAHMDVRTVASERMSAAERASKASSAEHATVV